MRLVLRYSLIPLIGQKLPFIFWALEKMPSMVAYIYRYALCYLFVAADYPDGVNRVYTWGKMHGKGNIRPRTLLAWAYALDAHLVYRYFLPNISPKNNQELELAYQLALRFDDDWYFNTICRFLRYSVQNNSLDLDSKNQCVAGRFSSKLDRYLTSHIANDNYTVSDSTMAERLVILADNRLLPPDTFRDSIVNLIRKKSFNSVLYLLENTNMALTKWGVSMAMAALQCTDTNKASAQAKQIKTLLIMYNL